MPKSKKAQIVELVELIELDGDTLQVYDEALGHIDHPDVREAVEAFEADHERHIADLTELIDELGGEAPPAKADLKGTVMRALTALRSATGTNGALKALRTDEKLTCRTYAKVVDAELPEPAAQVVADHLSDERRHLAVIEAMLADLQRRGGATTDEEPERDRFEDGEERDRIQEP